MEQTGRVHRALPVAMTYRNKYMDQTGRVHNALPVAMTYRNQYMEQTGQTTQNDVDIRQDFSITGFTVTSLVHTGHTWLHIGSDLPGL